MRKHFHYILLLGAILLFHFPVSLQAQYCKPSFGAGCNSIDSFKVGSYAFNKSGCSNGAVDTSEIGTTTPVKLYRGKTYTLRVRSNSTNAHYGVWLDYNADGDFKDDGELLIIDNIAGRDTLVSSFNIPATAKLLRTRLRVVSVNNEATDGGGGECRSYTNAGEAEDYDVEISAYDNDVTIRTLAEPTHNGCANSASPVKVVVKNIGNNTVTSIPIYVNFASSSFNQTFTTSLKTDESDTFTFSSTVNTSAASTYKVNAYTALKDDDDITNDSFNAEIKTYTTPSVTAPANQARCGLGNFTFTATSNTTGTKTFWYNDANSDSAIYAGNSFVTPAINNTTTYYYSSQYTLLKSLKTKYYGFLRANVGHMFDIKAKSSFIIDSFDIHFGEQSATQPANDTVLVYYKKGTYVGYETNEKAWTYVGKAYVKGQGIGSASRLAGFGSIPIEAGETYAIYMMHITNDASLGRFFRYDEARQNYSNADMVIEMGASFGAGGPFKGLITAGRAWDGEIFYHYKACASTRGSVTGSVSPSPLGAKILESKPFQGLVYDGSFTSPDLVCPGDTLTYEFTPPPPYTNADLGTKWQITNFTFTTVNGAYPNPKDTFTTRPTATKNATFSFVPNKAYGDSTFFMRIDLKMTDGGCTGSLARYITVGSKPTADFGFTRVCVGKPTSFTDSSDVPAGAIGYVYDFGDGTPVARTRNTTHTYTKAGKYTVTQTLTTSKGCGDKITKVVEVYEYPKPKFGANTVCVDNATQFTDSTANKNEIAGWLWKFDPNDKSATSTQQNPAWFYPAAGKYNVTLVITSIGGCKDSVTRVIEVMPRPKVDFAVTGACIGKEMTFTNTTTIASGTVTYKWRFDDGFTSTSSTTVKHAFNDESSYGVTLIATSAFGCKDSVTKIVVAYTYPKADFTSTPTCEGKIMDFADASTDGKTYSWNFGDPQSGTNNTSLSKTPSHYYTKAGTYQVKLKTFNENGCADSIVKTVTVSPLPKANFSFATACTGSPVQFTDKSSEANNAKLTYEWSTSNGLTSTDKDPMFTFATAGNYNVMLRIISEAGCRDSIQLTVPVTSPPAPKWSRMVDDLNKRKITFSPNDTTHQSYAWYFGTGDSSTAMRPSYTYADYGTYNVRLVVRTTGGCVAESTESLLVSPTSIEEKMQDKNFVKIYPNPFHNSTRVAFTLAERSQVQVTIWDVQGRRIAVLEDGNRNAGKHEYVFEADKYNAGAGVYILKVLVNDNYYTTQIVNVK